MKVSTTPVTYPTPAVSQKTKAEQSQAAVFDPIKSTAQSQKTAETSKPAQATGATEELPVEAYALPYWMEGFGWNLSLDSVPGAPAGYIAPENRGFAAATSADLIEYSDLLSKHLNEVYERNGISDSNSRYKATMLVPGLNERLHREFNESISADSRMMSLLNKLGVELV